MNTSSDIKALFDRFGGDATSYREIRMESEAKEARDRWPLLGMIDPRRVEVSATDKSHVETSAGPGNVAEAAPGMVSPGGGPSPRDRSQAALRRSAPLFTRSPRRDMAQAMKTPVHTAPESGAFRFSPAPGAQASPQEAAPTVPGEAVKTSPAAGEAAAAPNEATPAEPRNPAAPPRAADVPPALTRSAASPASTVQSAAAPGGTPLRKLFGAVPESAGQQVAAFTPAVADTNGHLGRLFERLRGGANPEPDQGGGAGSKAAAARPWPSEGVNGP